MKIMIFEIPMVARPKQRARRGKGGVFYTPALTKKAEKYIADIAFVEAKIQGWERVKKPKSVSVRAVYINPLKGSDIDNLEKALLDGLKNSGAIFDDDVQVCEASKVRFFCGLPPKIIVRLEVVENEEAFSRDWVQGQIGQGYLSQDHPGHSQPGNENGNLALG